MKHIESAISFKLTREATEKELTDSLMSRLKSAIDIESLEEKDKQIVIHGTTGGSDSITRHARIKLNITVKKQQEIARILIHGEAKIARSLMITYAGLVLLLLVVGLLPGSIETSGEDSGAMDALVLLLFGIFIFYDINVKVSEPSSFLDDILNSVRAEYG